MKRFKNQLVRLVKSCRKSEITYISAAKFCETGNLIALFKAYALERKEYQKVIGLALDKMGQPLYKSRKNRLLFFKFRIDLMNWLTNTNDTVLLTNCIARDSKLFAAYEEVLDYCEVSHPLYVKLRQQYNEIRKAIQELSIARETAKNS